MSSAGRQQADGEVGAPMIDVVIEMAWRPNLVTAGLEVDTADGMGG